jgi:hypothetical protein
VTKTTRIWVWTSKNDNSPHQHGSDIYRVLGLHRRHGSVHEFATSFRVRDKESKQRLIAELNIIHEGWGMTKRLRWRMEKCKSKQFSREGFLHGVRVSKCRCRGKMGSDGHPREPKRKMTECQNPHLGSRGCPSKPVFPLRLHFLTRAP